MTLPAAAPRRFARVKDPRGEAMIVELLPMGAPCYGARLVKAPVHGGGFCNVLLFESCLSPEVPTAAEIAKFIEREK